MVPKHVFNMPRHIYLWHRKFIIKRKEDKVRPYRFLFMIFGMISMFIGLIGIVVPVLPTTPFILLASACFVKSSEKLDRWFKRTKIYKNYAEDFIKERSMTLKRKIKILFISSLMLAFPLMKLDNIYIRFCIVLIIIFKYYYFFFRIKTKKEENKLRKEKI